MVRAGWMTLLVVSLSGAALALFACSSSSQNASGDDGGTGDDDGGSGDDGNGDDGNGDDSGFPCSPMLPSGFTATVHPPLIENVCTPQNLSDYYTACVNTMTSTNTACGAWDSTAKTCGACLQGPETAPSWSPGVIITSPAANGGGALTFYNFASCFQATDPSPAGTMCAGAVQAQLECEIASCLKPIGDCHFAIPVTIGDFSAYNDCVMAADAMGTGPCAPFVMGVVTACAPEVDAGGPVAACVDLLQNMAPPESDYTTWFAATCASSSGDGGLPPDAGGGG